LANGFLNGLPAQVDIGEGLEKGYPKTVKGSDGVDALEAGFIVPNEKPLCQSVHDPKPNIVTGSGIFGSGVSNADNEPVNRFKASAPKEQGEHLGRVRRSSENCPALFATLPVPSQRALALR